MPTIDYSRFDHLDSDDEDDAQPIRKGHPAANLPPLVQQKLAALDAANRSGDIPAGQRAAAELEAAMQSAPPQFREALEAVRASRVNDARQSSRALEEASKRADRALADESKLFDMLRETGLSEADILALEKNSNSDLSGLAERMVATTLSATPLAKGHQQPLSDGQAAEQKQMRERLEQQRQKLAMAEKQLADEQRAAEAARVEAERARSQLQDAEAKKTAQATKVDAAVEGAQADIVAEMQKRKDAETTQLRVASEVRERGNLAMRKGDLSACLALYDQCMPVLDSIGVSSDVVPTEAATLQQVQVERMQLLANRAACLLKMGRDEECEMNCTAALGDTETQKLLPARLLLKLLLRQAEARRRLGHKDSAAQAGLQAAKLVRLKKDEAGVSEEQDSAIKLMAKELLRSTACGDPK
eukprot:6213224-Pleurochrysis_carterae.AAC.2